MIDGVDATAPDLVQNHCGGHAPMLIVWGNPRVNMLTDKKPVKACIFDKSAQM